MSPHRNIWLRCVREWASTGCAYGPLHYPPPPSRSELGRMRQRESSKNGADEQLSKQTADRCEGARLLMMRLPGDEQVVVVCEEGHCT